MDYKFQRNRKTIGVWINRFEGRCQSLLFKGLMDKARECNVNILFFDGRSIDSPYSEAIEHSAIYRLASYKRLDGLIISSTVFNDYVSEEEVKKQLDYLLTLPSVSINMESLQVPNLTCDNYSGMKLIIQHLIQVHQFTKIAFVRGPQNNNDSEIRLKAYQDTLRENQIELDASLIYDGDFSTRSGEIFAEKLSQNPVYPFEAVAFGNDEMALGALSVFQSKGIEIPKEFAVSGFDNITDAFIHNPSLTTIHQPLYEEGLHALKTLIDKIEGKEVVQNAILPTRLIIRESCGCLTGLENVGLKTKSDAMVKDLSTATNLPAEKHIRLAKGPIIAEILTSIDCNVSFEGDIQNALNAIIDMMLFDLKNLNSKPMTLMVLNEWLELTLSWDFYQEIWQKMLWNTSRELRKYFPNTRDSDYIISLTLQMFSMLAKWVEHREERNYRNLRQFLLSFPVNFGRDHLHIEPDDILKIIQEELKKIGLQQVYLILYQGAPHPRKELETNKHVELKIAYDEFADYIAQNNGESIIFEKEMILPNGVIQNKNAYKLLWMELFIYEDHFGYLGIDITSLSPLSCYIIRESISGALYTAYLYQAQLHSKEEIQKYNYELKLGEERYRDMAMMLPAVIIETNTKLEIEFINHSGLDFLGMNRKETKPGSVREFLTREDYDKINELLIASPSVKDFAALEMNLVNPQNKRIIPVTRIDPVLDDRGVLKRLRWFALDLMHMASANVLPDEDFVSHYHLSRREKEVMDLIIQGFRRKDIAERLFIADSTVRGHITDLYDKLGIGKKSELLDLINQFQISHNGYQNYIYTLLSKLLNRE